MDRYAGCVTPILRKKDSKLSMFVEVVTNRYAKEMLYRYALRTP